MTMSTEVDLESIPESVTIRLSPEMREQLGFLSKHVNKSVEDLALELVATELDAEAGLSRGPYLRKYMYR